MREWIVCFCEEEVAGALPKPVCSGGVRIACLEQSGCCHCQLFDSRLDGCTAHAQ